MASCTVGTPARLRGRDAVYVAAVPLRAAPGPSRALLTAAYSLGIWDLQHFMVVVKPVAHQGQAYVFDFQPQNPESIFVALAALSRRQVTGVVLKRKLQRLPKSRCCHVGYCCSSSIDIADNFNKGWPTDLVIGVHDCRHYTSVCCKW